MTGSETESWPPGHRAALTKAKSSFGESEPGLWKAF